MKFCSRKGLSLAEILVAVAVGTLLVIAAATIIAPAIKINTQSGRAQAGSALAKELLDNVRVWSEGDWHRIQGLATSSANHYYLNTASSPFASSSGDESVTISTTTYKRYFYVDDVLRKSDPSQDIAASGAPTDPSTKKITVAYSWPQGATNTIAIYLTRYRDNVLDETDWSGGPGQDGPVTSTNSRFATSTKIDYTTTTGSIYVKLQ